MGTVANLAIRIGVNAQEFSKGIAGIQAGVTGLAQSEAFKQLGNAFREVAGGIDQTVDSASRIADMAARVGISAEAVQKLEFAATQTGSSFDAIATAMRVMSDKVVEGKLPEVISAMGVSLQELQAMTPDQAFLTLADAIARIPDPMQQMNAMVDTFGARSLPLLPAIKEGFAGVAEQAPLMSDALIGAFDRLGDRLDQAKLQIDAVRAQAMAPLVNTFMMLPGPVQTLLVAFGQFLPVIESLGIAILASGGPKAAFAALATAATGIVSLFTSVLPAAFGAILTFLGPVGLIATAVIGLVAVWYKWGDDIKAIHVEMFGVLKTWLVDKPLALFPTVGTGLATLSNLYHSTKDKVVAFSQQMYEGVKAWLVDKFNAIVESIRTKVNAVTGFFKDMYTAVVGQSYVPDMVAGIGVSFGQLDDLMVGRARRSTSLVSMAFESMGNSVLTTIDGLIRSMSSALTGWLDGFMPSWAAKLVGNVADGLLGMGSKALGGVLGSVGGAGSVLGGGLNATIDALGGGGAAAGAGGMGGLGGFFTNPWTIGIGAAAGLIGAIWKGGLFRGGEEGTKVNPARDEFFRDFQDRFGSDQAGSLHQAFAEAGISADVADRMTKRLFEADTMKEFEAATSAINTALAEAAEKSTTDAAALGVAAEGGSQAIAGLTAAITSLAETVAGLANQLILSAAGIPGPIMTIPEPPITALPEGVRTADGLWNPREQSDGVFRDENGNPIEEPLSFAGGSGGFRNFGSGRLAMLHGTEAVVKPEDMKSGGPRIVMNMNGTMIGSQREFEDAVARGYHRALERGGPHMGKSRSLARHVNG